MVLTYTEDTKQLIMQAVDSAKLAPLVSGVMEVPSFLDGDEFKFDDELARQLGVVVLNVIAAGRPNLSAFLCARRVIKRYSANIGLIYSETTRTGTLRKFGFDYKGRMVLVN